MKESVLAATARHLLTDGKGLLAMDESNATCNRRFAAVGIAPTEPARRAWRQLILTTPELAASISGVILYDETFGQATDDGVPFLRVLSDAGILPGIKVDIWTKPMAGFPNETVTEGLDGLRARLRNYAEQGARFAKWRAVFTIGDATPSRGCIVANAHALARYAALCQEVGLVPVIEPEVLMTGAHDLAKCAETTSAVLHTVFDQLFEQRVMLEGMILKPNMVLPGLDCAHQQPIDIVADATIVCLLQSVPAAVPGIMFLSGGQAPEQASARLDAMNLPGRAPLPWPLAFSYARAIQQPALDLWRGDETKVVAAQSAILHRIRCNRAARAGHYDGDRDMPKQDTTT